MSLPLQGPNDTDNTRGISRGQLKIPRSAYLHYCIRPCLLINIFILAVKCFLGTKWFLFLNHH